MHVILRYVGLGHPPVSRTFVLQALHPFMYNTATVTAQTHGG